ncbi:hypothetical protein ENSA7_03630 [Enhygromyxa salina]|uniref:Uncharacterized protein n=1 Tax=Enhygromyxa salina TaxID=215803 RepID=A0A2S9YXT6_9BACT|nr:hypothetical protein ENSA7_03630 [Enhygromyxa salina]
MDLPSRLPPIAVNKLPVPNNSPVSVCEAAEAAVPSAHWELLVSGPQLSRHAALPRNEKGTPTPSTSGPVINNPMPCSGSGCGATWAGGG